MLEGEGESVGYAYNAANELTDMTFSGPYTEQYDYAHDARGRVTRWTTNAFEWTYGYDADGQLTAADSALGTYSYDYDAAGNLIGDGQIHDAANRLQRDADYTYAYDGRGNLTGKRDRGTGERWAYEWDGRNRLVRREHYPDADAASPDRTTTYSYGPLGRRWSRTRGGTEQRFVYADLDRIATLDAGGNATQRVTFGPRIDEPLAISSGGQTRYLHGDRLGSITAASTASGTVASYRYSPYGRLLNDPADIGNDFRYTGREYEGDRLYYYRARYYDTGMRRFTAKDPILFRGGDTNLYAYAVSDPINFVDPNGLAKLEIKFGGGLFTGTIGGTAETGFGADTSGNFCIVTTQCSNQFTAGPGFAGLGVSGSASTGTFCPSKIEKTTETTADLGLGGVGAVSIARNEQGSVTGGGKAFGGLGAGLGAGILNCETRSFCVNPFE